MDDRIVGETFNGEDSKYRQEQRPRVHGHRPYRHGRPGRGKVPLPPVRKVQEAAQFERDDHVEPGIGRDAEDEVRGLEPALPLGPVPADRRQVGALDRAEEGHDYVGDHQVDEVEVEGFAADLPRGDDAQEDDDVEAAEQKIGGAPDGPDDVEGLIGGGGHLVIVSTEARRRRSSNGTNRDVRHRENEMGRATGQRRSLVSRRRICELTGWTRSSAPRS